MGSFYVTEALSIIHCANCAMTFAVPQRFEKDRRKDHKSFYCPQGHSQSYTAESNEEKFRRERDNARQQVARAEEEAARERRKAAAAQQETKRLKKRSSAGTCPCCSRTFSNMATHMKRQHPEFVTEGGANVVPIKAAK